MSRLVAAPRRIEFVILRTDSSPPVALHLASQRRSYLRLRSCGILRHGLSPCCCGAITGALIREVAGRGARGFEKEIPYIVAWIDLEEDPRLVGIDALVADFKADVLKVRRRRS